MAPPHVAPEGLEVTAGRPQCQGRSGMESGSVQLLGGDPGRVTLARARTASVHAVGLLPLLLWLWTTSSAEERPQKRDKQQQGHDGQHKDGWNRRPRSHPGGFFPIASPKRHSLNGAPALNEEKVRGGGRFSRFWLGCTFRQYEMTLQLADALQVNGQLQEEKADKSCG